MAAYSQLQIRLSTKIPVLPAISISPLQPLITSLLDGIQSRTMVLSPARNKKN